MLETTATVYKMPSTRKAPKPEYGKRLEKRREEIRKSYDRLAAETNDRLYKQWFYRLENGRKRPETLTPEEIDLLAQVLEWTPHQLAEALGISLPASVYGEIHGGSVQPVGMVAPVAFLGAVSAGLDENEGDVTLYRDTPIAFLAGSKPEDCFWLEVQGDSMACPDVRQSIPEGSWALFDRTKDPRPGKTICCILEKDGRRIRILKKYGRSDKYVILKSYNEEHEDILLEEGDTCTFLGTFIGHWFLDE